MHLCRLLITLLAAIALGVGGCRCPSARCVPAPHVAPCSYQRAPAVSDIPDLVTSATVDSDEQFLFACRLPSPSDQHRILDPHTCQCRAAQNARIAYLLELEQHWAKVLIECESEAVRTALCLTRDLLKLREASVRNDAAGAALTSYYTLAGVEVQASYLQLGITEVQDSLRRYDQLQQRGIDLPEEVDRPQLAAMLVDLQDQSLQLDLARVQLNAQLMRLLGCPLQCGDPFAPRLDWECQLTPPEVEAAAAEGMAYRSDVRAVRLTACRLEKATLPIARAILQVGDSALGSVEPQTGFCHALRCMGCCEAEEPIRKRQLCTLLKESRETALAKIKGATYQVEIQQRRVALARQAVLDRRRDLLSLQKLRDVQDVSVFELSLARGRVFTAEAALASRVAELKVAEVALKQEKGLLAVECGLGAELCCEPEPTYTLPQTPAACEAGELVIPTAG